MAGSNRVEDGKIVTVHYKLSIEGGEPVLDSTEDGDPMSYLHGADNIVPGLERELAGRSVGEVVTAVVAPDDGYGDRDDDAIQEIPRDAFPPDLELEPGMQLTAEDDDGNLTPMFVQSLAADHVVVDLNHPLAGKTLRYEVTIVGVRDATDDERAHGHAHGPDGHDHDHDHD